MKQVFIWDFTYHYNAEMSQSLANIIIKNYYNHHHLPKSYEADNHMYLHLYTGYNIPTNFNKTKKLR